ncbi:hypothetical protein RJ640_010905 [Escallonia rubra]|uniref:CCHC-type domain-containing protein n=1 Tax=Escallonia rubra TaxID=112253 RepID=A0AA88RSG8_9ASTE|nr:hypothetical protein RJ640_010905 [Escallonia rubra]
MTSSGSLDASANSTSLPFSFSNSFMTTSFSDLLTSGDAPTTATASVGRGLLADRIAERTGSVHPAVGRGSLANCIAERTGSSVPKFKSIPPPSFPLSPHVISHPSYFAIPPSLSPAELLDSPVLLSSSHENPDACYECGRTGHIKKYCPQLKNKTASSNSRDFKEKKFKSRKALLTWDDSDESNKEISEDDEVAQLCFMAKDDNSKVISENPDYNELKSAFLELSENYEKLKVKMPI